MRPEGEPNAHGQLHSYAIWRNREFARKPSMDVLAMIDIRQLRYFVVIVEQGSFSRAANHLNIAQPALSLHVRNMEAGFGIPLLHRNPRGVTPTEAGSILLRHARIIIDQLTVAEEEVRDHCGAPEGEVRLGVPGTIGQIIAVPLIAAVNQKFPGIKLRIAEAMSGFILEWLRDERIDLAVLYGQAKEHGIHTELLLDEPLHFFGPAVPLVAEKLPENGQTISFSQLSKLPLILPGQGHGLRQLLDEIAEQVKSPLEPVFDVDSYGNIKALVDEGLGYSILPENSISAEIREGRLRSWEIREPEVSRSVFLAYSAKRPMTNAKTAVLSLLRETIGDLVASGKWLGSRPAKGMG